MQVEMIPMTQEGTEMFVGVMRVQDILQCMDVDIRREGQSEIRGYQRPLEPARVNSVANYLRTDPRPLMPTSVLLSYRGKHLEVTRGKNGTVVVEFSDTERLWVVDGQHRLFGFRRAIDQLGLARLKDYRLPVVIVRNADIVDEASQFRTINETMKKVRTDLARQLLAMAVAERGTKGRQAVREQGRMWEVLAVEVIQMLKNDPDSPWRGRIQPPTEKKTKETQYIIRELSFSTSLRRLLNEPPFMHWPSQRTGQVLKEYWKAWQELAPNAFANPKDYVLLKTPGVFSLHSLAYYILKLLERRSITDPKTSDFLEILLDLGEYADESTWRAAIPPEELKDMTVTPPFLAGSMKGFAKLTEFMIGALQDAGHTLQ